MATLAFLLSAASAAAAYRWSRLCAAAFALAFGASAVYLGLAHLAPLHHAAGELEPLRLVSVVTGAMGAVELMRVQGVKGIRRRTRTAIRERRIFIMNRRDIVASLLIASSLVDGAAWLWWRGAGQWGPLPAVSCLLYVGVCVVGFWRRGRA